MFRVRRLKCVEEQAQGWEEYLRNLGDVNNVGTSENSTRSCKVYVAVRVTSNFKVQGKGEAEKVVSDIFLKNYLNLNLILLEIRLIQLFFFSRLTYFPSNSCVHFIASHCLEMAFHALYITAI